MTTGFSHSNGALSVYDQGAASEILTGIDPNGSGGYDIRINIGSTFQSYLGGSYLNNLWLDPNPTQRTDTLPNGRTDAMSVFLHEIGHGLAFNGWRDGNTGNLPAGYESTFDEQVVSTGGYLYFNGANARAAYGGPVPLTKGNYGHYGNAAPGPGSDLVGYSLMNGVSYYYGVRWGISNLDRGIMRDVGFTLNPVPEPASFAALGVGVVAFARRRRRS